MNEIFGSVALTLIAFTIAYFVFAGKIRLGFETTIFVGLIVILLGAIAMGNLTVVMAFATVFVAFAVASMFNRMVGQ